MKRIQFGILAAGWFCVGAASAQTGSAAKVDLPIFAENLRPNSGAPLRQRRAGIGPEILREDWQIDLRCAPRLRRRGADAKPTSGENAKLNSLHASALE